MMGISCRGPNRVAMLKARKDKRIEALNLHDLALVPYPGWWSSSFVFYKPVFEFTAFLLASSYW